MDSAGTPNVVIGLAAALILAVLAAHPAVRRIESRLGISVLTAVGLPFLLLGFAFALPTVGVLHPGIVSDLRPAFNIGLAWIGFVIGMQYDARWIAGLPSGNTGAALTQSLATMLVVSAPCALALLALGVPIDSPTLLRDALLLAACAAASAPLAARPVAPFLGGPGADAVGQLTRLSDFLPLLALGLAAAVYRPSNALAAWALPPVAWVILMLGLGGMCGLITWVLLRGARSGVERVALLLGAVALVAGVASHLALPPAAIGLLAGLVLANLPLAERDQLTGQMFDLERPLYLIFLLVAGTLWQPAAWQGWLLAVVFVTTRLVGKRLGALWAWRQWPQLPPPGLLAHALVPLSPVAVIVVVSAMLIFGDAKYPVMQWAVNAVIVGGVLSEILARFRRGGPARAADFDLEPRVPGAPAPGQ